VFRVEVSEMQRARRLRLYHDAVLLEVLEGEDVSRGDYAVLEQHEVSELHYNAALGLAIRERTEELFNALKEVSARSNFDDVGDFHEKFDLPNVTHARVSGPMGMPADLFQFRLKFLKEELDEFQASMEYGDTAGAFDALIDLVYVAMGTAHLLGFPWQEGWDLVQAANMAKERATSETASERGGTWDIVKPEGWQPPDIEGLLQKHGWPS
jgi:predicted HAD superfamily Cof-like phosphohydrolase